MHGQFENFRLDEVQNIFKEMRPENIRTSLKKMWLEDFYEFCTEKLNDTSSGILDDLLKFEADMRSIQAVYNTIGSRENSSTAKIANTRKQLSPAMGYLYPDSQAILRTANTLDALKEAVKGVENYKDIVKDAPDPQRREEQNFATTLDDLMYDEEIKRYSLVFDQAA